MRLMQLFPLGLHSHGMRATHLFARKVLQRCCKKKCAGRFLLDNRRCCTTLAKVRCLQTQTCEELEQSKVALPEIHWRKIRRPSLWSKGMVSGSVLFNGRRGCIDQEDDVLFLPLPPCCKMQSHKYTRGKRKTFQSFTGQPQRHSTRQNEGNQNAVS